MKNHIWKIITLITVVILFSVDSIYANNIKYYKNYSINEQDYSVVPEELLSKEQALETICNKFIYNDQGKLIQIEGFAYGLNFTDTYEKVNKIRFEYKENAIIKYFLNGDNEPLQNATNKVFGEKVEKTENGYMLYFLDVDGENTTNTNNIYSIVRKKTQVNNTVISAYYDKNNNLVKNNFGVYQVQKTYNTSGLVTKIRYLNIDGKLMINNDNYAGRKNTYNSNGKLVEINYFDPCYDDLSLLLM